MKRIVISFKNTIKEKILFEKTKKLEEKSDFIKKAIDEKFTNDKKTK